VSLHPFFVFLEVFVMTYSSVQAARESLEKNVRAYLNRFSNHLSLRSVIDPDRAASYAQSALFYRQALCVVDGCVEHGEKEAVFSVPGGGQEGALCGKVVFLDDGGVEVFRT